MKDDLKALAPDRLPTQLMSTTDLAATLTCSRVSIERMVKRGVLRPYYIGRAWRFDYRETIEALSKRRRSRRD